MLNYNVNEIKFQIQRIYVKDISFETPNTPQVFNKDWDSNLTLNIHTKHSQLSIKIFEVVLSLTVTSYLNEEIAFLCEVKQAGIFNIYSINKLYLEHFLSTYCPNILFPYASECINNLIIRGSFPQINLAPINFDKIFNEQCQKK
ncbi:protein-export chaperone SecB [Pantoea sp. SoEX]|uniref:protein-export chaperone SecB n=1 Tax=Pantoea sp. SoEX TaxID=2576763 RepID=UPI001358D03D|nr:protein-export chaperone SecB [Pantoea sp. SoEX]MXP51459.1 protein-export chaperone SecB [Pantoea sp. SoEX]